MKILPLLPLALLCAARLPCTGLAQVNNPTLPNINTGNIFNITNAPFNATTSSTDNSGAISNAISAASASSGGGTVEIPAGVFLSGPLLLKNGVNLQLDAGATLRMLAYGTWPGGTAPPDFISATSLHDLEVSGSGTIDGQATFSGWWKSNPSLTTAQRPYMMMFSKCQRVLIQNVTLKNPAKMHMAFKNSGTGNITVQGITVNTSGSSPNTDGIDILGTNCLIQNCTISDGDDNVAFGSSSVVSANIVVTNCTFGNGHGVSIGSNTEGGVSNITVINCTFNGTENGIRLKSDNGINGHTSLGGLTQNINYYNIGMTNVSFPIGISSYYNAFGDPPADVSASDAASQPVESVAITTPIWRNITLSNLNVTYTGSFSSQNIIWGRTEMPITNFTLINSKIKTSQVFAMYNAYGIQIINTPITVPSGNSTVTFYNANATFTNPAVASIVTVDGLTSSNSIALYNAPATFSASDALGENPITVSGCILSNSTDLTLGSTEVVNFNLGGSPATIGVNGGLTLNSPTLNIATNAGFGAGTYTLFDYTSGSLSGTPVLGVTPPGFNYTLTNDPVALQVNLLVTSTNVTSGTGPTVTNQPASQGFYTGQNATLVSGASGDAPLAYQWYFNTNSILAAATNSSLILTNLQTTNAGAYDVIVTNASGSATSAVANLTVILPPKYASTVLSGGNLVVSGNGGLPGSNYVVLGTTNVALPVSQWTQLATNPFNGSGNFSFTNATGANPQGYFRMQLP